MKEIQSMELGALMDMLSEQTAIYTRLLTEGPRTTEFDHARNMVQLLQQEIEYRKTEADMPDKSKRSRSEYSRNK